MAKRKGISKLALVREAVQTLGQDALPKAIQEEIKTKHRRNIDLNLISNYKNIVKNEGSPKPGKKKMGRPKKAAATAAASKNGKGGISLDDIKAVKALAERLGAAKLKELATVLG